MPLRSGHHDPGRAAQSPHPTLPSLSVYQGGEKRRPQLQGESHGSQGCRQDNIHPWDLNLLLEENRLNDSRTRIRAQATKCFVTLLREQITQSNSVKTRSKLYPLVMAPVWQLKQKQRDRHFTSGCLFCLAFSQCLLSPLPAHVSIHVACICTHTHPCPGAPRCYILQGGREKNLNFILRVTGTHVRVLSQG